MTRPRETAGKILNTLWEGCPVRRTLRVIFTADCHGYFYPTDYFGAQDENMGLLKLIASFERDENTLVIDGGDTIQGSPFTDWPAAQRSFEAKTSSIHSTGRLPRPISSRVPTVARTIFRKNRSARIVKTR